MDDPHALRLAAVPEDHLSARRPGGADQTLHFQGGVDVGIFSVPVIRDLAGVDGLEPGRDDNGPHLQFLDLFLLFEVDGVPVAFFRAGPLAHPGFELEAVLGVDEGNLRGRLREGQVNGFPQVQPQIEFVREAGLLEDARLRCTAGSLRTGLPARSGGVS